MSVEHKIPVLNSLVTDQEIKSLMIAAEASALGTVTGTSIAVNESINRDYIRQVR